MPDDLMGECVRGWEVVVAQGVDTVPEFPIYLINRNLYKVSSDSGGEVPRKGCVEGTLF